MFVKVIVNDITNFCCCGLSKPYAEAFTWPKVKVLMSSTIKRQEELAILNE